MLEFNYNGVLKAGDDGLRIRLHTDRDLDHELKQVFIKAGLKETEDPSVWANYLPKGDFRSVYTKEGVMNDPSNKPYIDIMVSHADAPAVAKALDVVFGAGYNHQKQFARPVVEAVDEFLTLKRERESPTR